MEKRQTTGEETEEEEEEVQRWRRQRDRGMGEGHWGRRLHKLVQEFICTR